MGTKLKRAQALATKTSSVGRPRVAGRRRQAEESRQPARSTGPHPEAISFSLGDLRDMRIDVVAKGVIVKPPRPRLIVEVTFEVPIDPSRC